MVRSSNPLSSISYHAVSDLRFGGCCGTRLSARLSKSAPSPPGNGLLAPAQAAGVRLREAPGVLLGCRLRPSEAAARAMTTSSDARAGGAS
jgi:hypothetical protein